MTVSLPNTEQVERGARERRLAPCHKVARGLVGERPDDFRDDGLDLLTLRCLERSDLATKAGAFSAANLIKSLVQSLRGYGSTHTHPRPCKPEASAEVSSRAVIRPICSITRSGRLFSQPRSAGSPAALPGLPVTPDSAGAHRARPRAPPFRAARCVYPAPRQAPTGRRRHTGQAETRHPHPVSQRMSGTPHLRDDRSGRLPQCAACSIVASFCTSSHGTTDACFSFANVRATFASRNAA